MQGTPSQHGVVAVHAWPYAAQVPVPASVVVVVVLPPHVPCVDPGGTLHVMPEQQSAVVVHGPFDGTHVGVPLVVPPAQISGGFPAGFGVQGRPQQSALEAHALPTYDVGFVQSTAAMRHRGMPSASCLQVLFCWTLPEQHSSVALHSIVFSRQMPPAGEHLLPCVQRPSVAPLSLLQVTFVCEPSGCVDDPQQSTSFAQISPVGWHPLGG